MMLSVYQFLFPMYSSKFSWIETDFSSAAAGTMEPDVGEWGNANFATALSIPMFPGFGKLIFLSDPSIFINRYTQQTDLYDNMNLILNLVDMATYDQEITADNPKFQYYLTLVTHFKVYPLLHFILLLF